MLVSIVPKDYSFVTEVHFTRIFAVLSELRMKTNCMQNSAVSFSFSTNNDPGKLQALKKALSSEYDVHLTEGAELVTIRYYDDQTIARTTRNKQILLEHLSGTSAQLVVK